MLFGSSIRGTTNDLMHPFAKRVSETGLPQLSSLNGRAIAKMFAHCHSYRLGIHAHAGYMDASFGQYLILLRVYSALT